MLKDIRIHLHADEEVQSENEKNLAERISTTHKANVNAFTRHMPSLLPFVRQTKATNLSLFCNKDGKVNIVDYGTGRTVYGLDPEKEVQTQFDNYKVHPDSFIVAAGVNSKEKSNEASIIRTAPSQSKEDPRPLQLSDCNQWLQFQKREPLPDSVECMVVFGCGLGYHLMHLLEATCIKHLVIYEPDIQFLQCSSMILDWRALLNKSDAKRTSIYFQIGKDGRDLLSDINELQTICKLSEVYFYQHYNHTIFNAICADLRKRDWHSIASNGLSLYSHSTARDSFPMWQPPVTHKTIASLEEQSEKFANNLKAFKRYYPHIYNEFKDYKPTKWFPCRTGSNGTHQLDKIQNGEVNAMHAEYLVSFCGDFPKLEGDINFNNFSKFPNKDGVILGYNGKKLAHYLHYQYVKKTEAILNEVHDKKNTLPHHLQSLIVFGLGLGYQLESLFESHSVENLFICEPNRDLFFTSIYAIDWASILETADEKKQRVYINIGDDGTYLFKDLMEQFYTIGPYILANTYFYQCYHNSSLTSSIAQLREQLRIVIMMGEYFDHAFYGINQTRYAIAQGCKLLSHKPSQYLSGAAKEVPVFLVGNGPSLDYSIDVIKENVNGAIIISCGTALRSLHKFGITPDYHAEIEQNRSTFDWVSLVDDPEYIKQISLLSCNGIHPDTIELFKETLLVFKEGESSTTSALEILGRDNFEVLEFAFPTVANLALNFVTRFRFNNVYLFGIDLGFTANGEHHSKNSAYYTESGKEVYDYSQDNNTSLIVEGNFLKTVRTKHEFKVAKELMEGSIVKCGYKPEIFNCSNGAKIRGVQPLDIGNVLILSSKRIKQEAIDSINDEAFVKIDTQDFSAKFEKRFPFDRLENQLNRLETIIADDPSSTQAVMTLTDRMKKFLFESYRKERSLIFYYLYGTMNYTNAMLIKLIDTSAPEAIPTEHFYTAMDIWRNTLQQLRILILSNELHFDSSSYRRFGRELLTLRTKLSHKKITLFSAEIPLINSIKYLLDTTFDFDFQFCHVSEINMDKVTKTLKTSDFVLVGEDFANHEVILNQISSKKSISSLVIRKKPTLDELDVFFRKHPNLCQFVHFANEYEESEGICTDNYSFAFSSLLAVLNNCNAHVILPKLTIREDVNNETIEKLCQQSLSEFGIMYDYKWFVSLNLDESLPNVVANNGSRAKRILDNKDVENLVTQRLPAAKFTNHVNTINDLKLY